MLITAIQSKGKLFNSNTMRVWNSRKNIWGWDIWVWMYSEATVISASYARGDFIAKHCVRIMTKVQFYLKFHCIRDVFTFDLSVTTYEPSWWIPTKHHEGTDQSAALRSLKNTFTVCMSFWWVLDITKNMKWSIISGWVYADADLSFCWSLDRFAGISASRLK